MKALIWDCLTAAEKACHEWLQIYKPPGMRDCHKIEVKVAGEGSHVSYAGQIDAAIQLTAGGIVDATKFHLNHCRSGKLCPSPAFNPKRKNFDFSCSFGEMSYQA